MIFFLLYQSMYFGIVLSRYIYVDPSIASSIPNYAKNNNFTPFRNENAGDRQRMPNGMFPSQAQQLERMFYNNQQADGFNNNNNSLNSRFTSAEYNSESLERQASDLLDFIQQRTEVFSKKHNEFVDSTRRSDGIDTEATYVTKNYYPQDNSENTKTPLQILERPRNNEFNFNENTLNVRSQSYAPSENAIHYPTGNNNQNNYPTPIIKKHVYFHTAPTEPTPIPNPAILVPRKNYKIIFIKTPSQDPNYFTRLQLQQAAQQIEDKTLIYVLSKKPEEPQLPSTNYEPSKPEVYFIKYKNRNSSVTDAETSLIEQSIVNGMGNSDQPTSNEGYIGEEPVGFFNQGSSS